MPWTAYAVTAESCEHFPKHHSFLSRVFVLFLLRAILLGLFDFGWHDDHFDPPELNLQYGCVFWQLPRLQFVSFHIKVKRPEDAVPDGQESFPACEYKTPVLPRTVERSRIMRLRKRPRAELDLVTVAVDVYPVHNGRIVAYRRDETVVWRLGKGKVIAGKLVAKVEIRIRARVDIELCSSIVSITGTTASRARAKRSADLVSR